MAKEHAKNEMKSHKHEAHKKEEHHKKSSPKKGSMTALKAKMAKG